VPRWGINGALLLLSLNAFMAWIRTTLPFHFIYLRTYKTLRSVFVYAHMHTHTHTHTPTFVIIHD
jgi:hypothetical protein